MTHKPQNVRTPRVFIGSSVEGHTVAEAIQSGLEHDAECTIWNQGLIQLSSNTIDALLAHAGRVDWAILVMTPDDLITKRGRERTCPRDNVLFEAGLFMGTLGREKTVIVYPKDLQFELPSDLAGYEAATYKRRADNNLDAALGPVCARLKKAFRGGSAVESGCERLDGVELEGDPTPRPRRTRSLGFALVGPTEKYNIVNISETGALLETNCALENREVLELELVIADTTVPVTAKVVRVQEPNWGVIGGVGVAFDSLPKNSRTLIRDYVMDSSPPN